MSVPVRTRYAPSPTGFLHLGAIRTSLFSWLLAKRYGGSFILRIEDTDRERLVPGAIASIVEDFSALGIEFDEGPSAEDLRACDPSWAGNLGYPGEYGPYVQSQRLAHYREAIEQLIEKGVAYRCNCSVETLAAMREEQKARKAPLIGYDGRCRDKQISADSPHVVRFALPQQPVVLDDVIRGKVSWESPQLCDPVLLKMDGYPTYHLACTVDDHHMQISHVLRGEEWLATAPIHACLYDAFGWERPKFAHLPVVLGPDGKKLSKRHGAKRISEYLSEGYLADAMLNFLVLIGWSPGSGDEQEVFSKEELCEKFSLERVGAASGIFSIDKLDWMNGVYIRNLSDQELATRLESIFRDKGLVPEMETLVNIVPYVRERLKVLPDALELLSFLFTDKLERDMSAMFKKGVDEQKALTIVNAAYTALEELPEHSIQSVEAALRSLPEALELKIGSVLGVIRIAITGKKVTPPLFESLWVLGKQKCLQRLVEVREMLTNPTER